MTLLAVVIYPDGRAERAELPGGDGGNLAALYALIGCDLVDVVRLADDLDMWLDDEGRYRQEVNGPATRLAGRFGLMTQDLYGPAVLTGGADDEGRTLALAEAVAAVLLAEAPGGAS